MLYSVAAIALILALFYKPLTKPKGGSSFPLWATLEIALTTHIVSEEGLSRRILTSIRRYDGSLFGLTSVHQVLVKLPGVDRLLSQSYHTIHTEPIQYTLLTRVFGATDTPSLKKKLEDSWKDLLVPVERAYLNDAVATAAIEGASIAQKTASLVTFSADTEHMKQWELSARIRVVIPDLPDKPGMVEACLQSLVRDFGACISMPLLYGQDFLDRAPQLLDDFWKFDNDLFPLLMIGVPPWAPLKTMKEGLAARSRLTIQIEALSRRIEQYQRGEPVDFGADMSDISSTALGRHQVYKREKWSFRDRGTAELALLWGQNANTQPVLFWLLAYVFSTPGILARVREEIADYVAVSKKHPPEITSLDLPALCRDCPLLRACVFETYRLTVEATSIRYISRSISIDDGVHKHELRPGMFISVPHSLPQRDPTVYADPDSFVPDRFLEPDPESEKLVARYGKLKPWGAGAGMCKGRKFAEKQIMAAGAAIISLWNIGPANGTWELPAMMPGTGVRKPVKDIRVVITRRVIEVGQV